MATPRRGRVVFAARKARTASGSCTARYCGASFGVSPSSGDSNRWNVHHDAYPSSSARVAISTQFSVVAHDPETGTANPSCTSDGDAVQGSGVVVEDGGPLVVRQRPGVLGEQLLAPRPGRVGVREVVGPEQATPVHLVGLLERRPVVLERHVDVLGEV